MVVAASSSCRFFAAQTLHAKCLRDVRQLPLASLRDSLLRHFVYHAAPPLPSRPILHASADGCGNNDGNNNNNNDEVDDDDDEDERSSMLLCAYKDMLLIWHI